MSRRIRDHSSLRLPTLEAGRISAPWPVHNKMSKYLNGTSASSFSTTKTFAADGDSYQLGELKVSVMPYSHAHVTIQKNGVDLLDFYGDMWMHWQDRSINSWTFAPGDKFKIATVIGSGVRWAYSHFVAFWQL